MKRLLFFVVAVLLISMGNAYADGNLTLTKSVFHEVEVKGKDGKIEKKMVPATTVVPGTEVFFVVTYQNHGEKPAEKVVITNPVPKELEYITSTITPSVGDLKVSVDGGKVYDDLKRLEVKGADGKVRPARASDVTEVRWLLKSDVAPGGEGSVSFLARLK